MSISKSGIKLACILAVTTFITGCSFTQILDGVTNAVGIIKGVRYFLALAPPASDLASFDAAQMTNNLNLNNLVITSNSGTVTVKISDQSTSAVLGQNSFPFTVNPSKQVVFANTSSVNTWVRSFSTYPGYINIDISGEVSVTPVSTEQGGSAQATAVYHSAPVASGSFTFQGHPKDCNDKIGEGADRATPSPDIHCQQ